MVIKIGCISVKVRGRQRYFAPVEKKNNDLKLKKINEDIHLKFPLIL